MSRLPWRSVLGTQYDVESEIESQPDCWRRAAEHAADARSALPRDGEKVAVFGCGTSLYMAQAYAALREGRGKGETDAFAASELPKGRRYDRYLAITRSGTTTEVLGAITDPAKTTAITAVAGTPVTEYASPIVLDFADERSVVQTRFATSALALLRASLGEDLTEAVADAKRAMSESLETIWVSAEQISFLGTGWTFGLANEAALKLREAAQLWTESYLAMEYRHGPISIAQPGRLTWMFGTPPAGLAEDVAATGATFVRSTLDPMAHLVVAHRLAVAHGRANGLDPDHPRSLTRSVVLP
jgi:fructoselysine-6-P-deglycase FrlB-like protein